MLEVKRYSCLPACSHSPSFLIHIDFCKYLYFLLLAVYDVDSELSLLLNYSETDTSTHSQKKHSKCVEMDLKNPLLKFSKKQKELLTTVETGTLPQVQKLIRQCRNWKKHESFGYVLLVTGLHRKHKSLSKFLIKEDCTVKGPKTGTYCTPLYYAVKMNDLEIFKLLWMKGASAFAKDANEDTALELAMYKKRFEMITLILNDVRLPENSKNLKCNCKDDIALFHVACWVLDSELIQTFISKGFSVKSRSTFSRDEWTGLTPLHFVMKRYLSYDSTLTILLKHGADFYAEDNQGRTPLHLAFRDRNTSLFYNDIIRENLALPNKRRFLNPVDKNGLSLLHIFCTMSFRYGDNTKKLNYIRYFIDNKADLNASVSLEDEQFPGYTALLFAANNFSWQLLELLLESGADPRKSDKNGVTPLHLVCRSVAAQREGQQLEIVKLFLRCGADPTQKDFHGRTPLHIAFCTSHRRLYSLNDLEKLLLSHNPQGINHTDKNGLSYLHIACTGDDLDIVNILVTQGASLNSCVHENSLRYAGYTALHIAVEFTRITFVQFLLAHGADVNVADKYKDTPLHLACDHTIGQFYESGTKNHKRDVYVDWLPSRKAHLGIIKSLIQEGASIDARNSSGKTPLLVNCYIPRELLTWNSDESFVESMANEVTFRQKFIMDILLKLGADINACCNDGNVLHILSPYYPKVPGTWKLLEIALKKGADVNAVGGSKKWTPLHVVVDESMKSSIYTSLMNLLLNHGANINARDGNFNTPLHLALQSYHSNDYTLIRLLIHPDIDINARNCNNETPLHLAIARRNPHCTNMLVNYGADINAEDDDGHTPIYALLGRLKEYGIDDEYIRKVFYLVLFRVMFMVRLKLHVSEEVSRVFDCVSPDGLALVDSNIDEELNHLKSERIDSYTTFYDILFKDYNAMAKHAKNRTFEAVILSIREGYDFSMFDPLLDRQFEKGLSRLNVLDPAKSALNSITKINWPDCCFEIISGYLSNDDLKFLIKSAPAVEKREKLSNNSSSLKKRKAKIPRRK